MNLEGEVAIGDWWVVERETRQIIIPIRTAAGHAYVSIEANATGI